MSENLKTLFSTNFVGNCSISQYHIIYYSCIVLRQCGYTIGYLAISINRNFNCFVFYSIAHASIDTYVHNRLGQVTARLLGPHF